MQSKITLLLAVATVALRGQALSSAWVEMGESGIIARIIVATPRDCPSLEIDGRVQPMLLRTPVPAGLRPACEASIPAAARSASVNGQALKLPRGAPSRVIVFGDTGCRVKDDEIQACNNPDLRPFAQVSATAADERPDLVIHVAQQTKCSTE